MSKSIEDYLRILFPQVDITDSLELEEYMRVSQFLDREFVCFEEEYNSHARMLETMDEDIYTKLVLDFCMEEHDDFTKIRRYLENISSSLNQNSYISKNFEDFLKVMRFQRKQAEEYQNQPVYEIPISLERVKELTREFLSQMDPSSEMVEEFDRLNANGGIVLPSSGSQRKSEYVDGKIKYAFDGTINTAHTLLHEFMHHWVEKKASPNMSREEHSMLFEYESIYYEKAFIKFLDEKGMLKYGTEPIEADRFKKEYGKDPDNCILMFLELANINKKNGSIRNQDIIDVMKKYHPSQKSDDDVLEGATKMLAGFIEENYFAEETVNGPIMYRFNHGLALKTPLTLEAIQNIHKLAPLVKDTEHDNIFMLEYFRMLERMRETEQVDGMVPFEAIMDTFGKKGEDGIFSLDD